MNYKEPPKVTRTSVSVDAPRSSGGSGLLGVGSSLVTGLVNNLFARANARDQREWQEKMWNKQNAYNDPSAMKERMLAAGLNPYQMTGAEPAGSAGTGATADTIPLQDPLSAIRSIAEIKGINATTSKTESESDKILQETINLRIAEQLGLIDADEARARWNDLKHLYGTNRSPVELSTQKTEKEIKLIDEQAYTEWYKQMEHLSQSNLNDALTNDSNALRQGRVDLLSAQNDDYRSQIARRLAQTAIDYASLKVYQSVGKSQQLLNNSMTDNERREYREGLRTFDARKTALEIGNEIGLTQKSLNEYANSVNEAWQELMNGNPFTSPKEYFNALGLVYGDTLRSIAGNVSAFIPLDPSKVPTPRNKIGY